MKRRLWLVVPCALGMLFIVSCSKKDLVNPAGTKDNSSGNVQTPDPVSANDVVETRPPVQKAIAQNVSTNIAGYMEALPARYDSTTKNYPLIIFLHGMGESGNGTSEIDRVAAIATPALIRQGKFPASFTSGGKQYSFIVLSPQFKNWPTPGDVDAMITHAISKYRIDASRIYLTGLSMGGGGVWEYASTFNSRVAAIAPVCGASWPNDQKAQKIAQGGMAVWAFHNQDDPTIAAQYSIDYVNKINSFGPSVKAKLTLWNTGGHDAWTKASDPQYRENGMNVYEWFLQYSK